MSVLLSDHIETLDKEIAKFKFVHEKFPDAKFHNKHGFLSKTINKEYTHWKFITNYGLYVMPYTTIDFEYNNVVEKISVHSTPRKIRLCYLKWSRLDKISKIHFSRFNINLKNHKFKDDIFNDCRVNILEFVAKHSKYQLNLKHLEPRLQKLLIFT